MNSTLGTYGLQKCSDVLIFWLSGCALLGRGSASFRGWHWRTICRAAENRYTIIHSTISLFLLCIFKVSVGASKLECQRWVEATVHNCICIIILCHNRSNSIKMILRFSIFFVCWWICQQDRLTRIQWIEKWGDSSACSRKAIKVCVLKPNVYIPLLFWRHLNTAYKFGCSYKGCIDMILF